jgi:hypothetical protein
MVATCANPACNLAFTNLSRGRLYLLPPENTASLGVSLIDFCYWLCPDCAALFTIVRDAERLQIAPKSPSTTVMPTVAHAAQRPLQQS